MATFQFLYTDIDLWLESQETVTLSKIVTAQDQDSAIDWFESNIQADWDECFQVEETA